MSISILGGGFIMRINFLSTIYNYFRNFLPRRTLFFSPNFETSNDPWEWIWDFKNRIDEENRDQYFELDYAINRLVQINVELKCRLIWVEEKRDKSLSDQNEYLKVKNQILTIKGIMLRIEMEKLKMQYL